MLVFFEVFFLVVTAAVGVPSSTETVVAERVATALGLLLLTMATAAFFFDVFFVGDEERCRLLAPFAAFVLLDERALVVFFVLAAFLLPLEAFERLRPLPVDDFLFVDFFFLPADERFVDDDDDEPNLKLPFAPTPFVCFNVLFFTPARNAALRCRLTVVTLTL